MDYNVVEVPAGTSKGTVALQHTAFVESYFEVERIIPVLFHFISFHWGSHFGSYDFPSLLAVRACLSEYAFFFLDFIALFHQAASACRAQPGKADSVLPGFGEEGQRIGSTLWKADRLGKGRVAWLSPGMLTLGFNLSHNTASLLLCRPHLAGKICSNFAQ